MNTRNHLQRLIALTLVLLCLAGCGKSRNAAKEIEKITLGIDVARYQGNIDWQQVAQSGVEFAMIRVGYRGMEDGEITEDRSARYNMQEAAKAGIPIGAYFFSTAISEEEAAEEAAWVAEILSGYPITYPVVYDCENFKDPNSRQYSMSKGLRTNVALAFLETIEKLGYEGMFYGSKNDLQDDSAWDTSRINEDYKIWVAQYPQLPYPTTAQSSYTGTHHMWQYTTEGVIPGISRPVDLNVAYFGYEGISERQAKEAPEEVGEDVEALMNFEEVDEEVTAKAETNLRNKPSQDADSLVMDVLENGEVARRIAVSDNGWSKLEFEGNVYYAVSSYLTTDLKYGYETDVVVEAEVDSDAIQTQFYERKYEVTAKDEVNLRRLPSVEHEDADVIAKLKHGDVATCIGVSDNGWSKLVYRGTVCYAISSYLEEPNGSAASDQPETVLEAGEQEIQTQFEPVSDRVTAKKEVNLRSMPSTEHPDCVVVVKIKNGDVVLRTGINRDVGWSRVEYNGQTLYCISSYLTAAG